MRPLVSGFMAGVILGDPVKGAMVGAQINILYLGFIGAGGAFSGDICLAGVVGTTIAITGNLPVGDSHWLWQFLWDCWGNHHMGGEDDGQYGLGPGSGKMIGKGGHQVLLDTQYRAAPAAAVSDVRYTLFPDGIFLGQIILSLPSSFWRKHSGRSYHHRRHASRSRYCP